MKEILFCLLLLAAILGYGMLLDSYTHPESDYAFGERVIEMQRAGLMPNDPLHRVP